MAVEQSPTSASPLVTVLLGGKAPEPLRLSAARGVLPLERAETVRILVFLTADTSAQVRRAASVSLASIPENELQTLLADPATAVEVLHHFGATDPRSEKLRRTVLINPSTPDATMRTMIPHLTKGQIDDLLLQHTRLIASPDLLDRLELNPCATPLHHVRIDEIRRHFLGAAPPPPLEQPPTPEPPPEPAEAAPVEPPEPAREAEEPVEEPPADEASMPAEQRIMRLSSAEKVKLAHQSTREERAILIKDSSRTVQAAVMASPMLTDQEVETFARLRSVDEEVLRLIATNKAWMKKYSVVHALATNPKTPIGIGMKQIVRLRSRDLKLAILDRNLPDAIRRQARKILDVREQRAR